MEVAPEQKTGGGDGGRGGDKKGAGAVVQRAGQGADGGEQNRAAGIQASLTDVAPVSGRGEAVGSGLRRRRPRR